MGLLDRIERRQAEQATASSVRESLERASQNDEEARRYGYKNAAEAAELLRKQFPRHENE